LDYQWYLGASPLSGETNSALTIASVSACDAGGYTVVITNYAGSVTSDVAVVVVTNAPSLISPASALAIGTQSEACGNLILAGGSSYLWEINDANGPAGTGWDLLSVTGGIDVQASSGDPFTVNLVSLNGVAPGLAANWNNDTTNIYTIATVTDAVTNFAADKFVLNDANFSNDLAGGVFSIEEGSLKLKFTPNHAPVATSLTNNRAPNLAYQIEIASLLTGVTSDPDGDARILTVLGTSTNGVTVTTNATHILYSNVNNVEDEFTYTVRDVRSSYRTGDTVRTATGSIRFTVNAPTGTNGNVLAISFTNGVVGMRFSGIPEYFYEVQRATDLTPPITWTTLHTTNCPASGLFDYIDLTPPAGAAFYRTVRP
jgi:hypothetical protein